MSINNNNLGYARLACGIVLRAINDLKDKSDATHRQDAKMYFRTGWFDENCALASTIRDYDFDPDVIRERLGVR